MRQLIDRGVIDLARQMDLRELVGKLLKLHRKGEIDWGCCPFHDDKTPSFKVERTFFKCFGCGAGGDVIAWLQQAENLSFPEAVARLIGDGAHIQTSLPAVIEAQKSEEGSENEKRTWASRIWRETFPLIGTPGEWYFVDHRQLDVAQLHLDHVLRWHPGKRAVIALMTDPVTAKPSGIHRTFLDDQAQKLERKMLGPQGVVRLSPDDEVTSGLGITEGIEDGLAILLAGWAPVWAAGSAGAIAKFPVLAGIECLTIFADADPAGATSATQCADRWRLANRIAAIVPPPRTSS